MKKNICLAALITAILLSSSAFASENVTEVPVSIPQKPFSHETVSKDGYFNGIRLAGKVKVVEHFGNIKVQVVNSFPDLKVKIVDNFPDKIGEWKFVDSFADFTIQFVTSFPDIKIQFVNNFPGVP
ncbi:MAG: hypothetical protein J5906_09790 [Acidaminococcaceae bacterium]|nr:hypothetical protein [Acidaminococcaceae bacterium]